MKTYSRALQPVRSLTWRAKGAWHLNQHPVERHAVTANHDMRGIHDGARCFILGNGPSLLDDDLSVLDGEILFTVNNLLASELGAPIPKYHVISDRRFFSLAPNSHSEQAVVERLVSIISGRDSQNSPPPTTFVPSSEYGFLEQFLNGRPREIKYFCNPFYFSDYYQMSADLTGLIPRFSSVIQHAIVIAIFMGFQQIYLLGCDATNIVANVNTALSESVASSYAYPVSPEVDQWFREQYSKRNMERCAESFLEVLVAFRFISDFCQNRRVELINCSSKTVVDSVTRSRLRDVL